MCRTLKYKILDYEGKDAEELPFKQWNVRLLMSCNEPIRGLCLSCVFGHKPPRNAICWWKNVNCARFGSIRMPLLRSGQEPLEVCAQYKARPYEVWIRTDQFRDTEPAAWFNNLADAEHFAREITRNCDLTTDIIVSKLSEKEVRND